jgi:hypothetical protein
MAYIGSRRGPEGQERTKADGSLSRAASRRISSLDQKDLCLEASALKRAYVSRQELKASAAIRAMPPRLSSDSDRLIELEFEEISFVTREPTSKARAFEASDMSSVPRQSFSRAGPKPSAQSIPPSRR